MHISTSFRGGAGIAAYRIHEALLRNGIDSHFVCIDDAIDLDLKFCTRLSKYQHNVSLLAILIDKIKWRLKNHFNFIIHKRKYFNDLLNSMLPKLNCEMATLPFSDYDLFKHPAVQNADIIHLHWVAGMLDYPSFFRHNTKPVVWTLHDMNPIQGIFHYKDDEIRNKVISSDLNAKVLHIKQKAIQKSKHEIAVVCPSKWMLKNVMKNKAFNNPAGYCIANPLDMDLFYPKEEESLRTVLNIPEGNTVFLFVSQIVENHRKGFDLLLGAFAKIKDMPVTLLIIGDCNTIHIPELDIRLLGTINDNEKLIDYYSLADAFIIPSREDNLPNVMLEAMACGTPVLAFNVGGMAEIIQDGFNGLKAQDVSVDSLKNLLLDFINRKEQFNSEEIRKLAVNTFSYPVIASKYIELYKKSLN